MRTQSLGAVLTLSAALFAGLCAAQPTSALAQVVWRCGPEGRTYSDSPCPGGQALAFHDRRQASDTAAAWADVKRQQAWAQAAGHEREVREARAVAMSALAANLGPASAETAAERSVKTTPKSTLKPKAKRQRQRQSISAIETEEAGTWRATALASRRAKG